MRPRDLAENDRPFLLVSLCWNWQRWGGRDGCGNKKKRKGPREQISTGDLRFLAKYLQTKKKKHKLKEQARLRCERPHSVSVLLGFYWVSELAVGKGRSTHRTAKCLEGLGTAGAAFALL